MSECLRLYLIRHGETAWSITGQHAGSTDIALTPHGEDEARGLAPWLQNAMPFSHVFSSPSLRARQTCELAQLADHVVIEPDLAEWAYGDYDAKLTVDIQKDRPGWNVWRDGCPNGVLPTQVADRADRLLTRLRSMHGHIALFSHGQFGSGLAARWIGLPLIEGQHFPLAPASISILGHEPLHSLIPAIVLWNMTAATKHGGT